MSVKVVHHLHEPYDIYIGRPSILGNPWTFEGVNSTQAQFTMPTRAEAIEAWAKNAWERMQIDPEFREAILNCHGKTVGCWCKPQECHGDRIGPLIERWHKQQQPSLFGENSEIITPLGGETDV